MDNRWGWRWSAPESLEKPAFDLTQVTQDKAILENFKDE
jgi:hypothetical protein